MENINFGSRTIDLYFPRFINHIIKFLVKLIPAINLDIEEIYVENKTKEDKLDSFIREYISYYKNKGYSRDKIISIIEEQCKGYNINFHALPKTVYLIYDQV